MREFKRLAAVAVAAIALAGLSGCQAPGDVGTGGIPPGHSSSGPNEDGRLCSQARSGEVYIQVGYDATGMPVVHPERCHVIPGTKVTWRGPDNDQRGFEIDFKAASASARGQDRIPSEAGGDRRKASIVAKPERGSYAYSVKANGKELDPQIIIDPR
ncbi:MAG TPA: hypothetical protein VFS99_00635 [Xanthomonadaceae bacterium]|nr:hypothetical protein [Xanthomonadaceae bacterium]